MRVAVSFAVLVCTMSKKGRRFSKKVICNVQLVTFQIQKSITHDILLSEVISLLWLDPVPLIYKYMPQQMFDMILSSVSLSCS